VFAIMAVLKHNLKSSETILWLRDEHNISLFPDFSLIQHKF